MEKSIQKLPRSFLVLIALVVLGVLIQRGQPPAVSAFPPLGGKASLAPLFAPPPLEKEERIFVLKKGENLMDKLMTAGLSPQESLELSLSLQNLTDTRYLKAGQEIQVLYGDPRQPETVSLPLGLDRVLTGVRSSQGRWTAQERWRDIRRIPQLYQGVVETSLFETAASSGIPAEAMMAAIHLLSYDIDFQRDIQPGNKITLLAERLVDEEGRAGGTGDLLYARLEQEHQDMEIWQYQSLDGQVDWYDSAGASVRKALFRTPLDGAYISSGFGMRRHPVRGYHALHRGIDFAAKTGTPVWASGNGVVTRAEWSDSYGYYVKLRHANHYETLYGHFSRIAPGITKGVRVKQGQTIGYVGSTGISTGPHCHYEVIYYGKPVNPSTVKSPPERKLEGEEHRLFLLAKEALGASFLLGD